MAKPFNLKEFGPWAARLADHPVYNALLFGSDEMMDIVLVKRTWRGKLTALKMVALMVRDKVMR